MSQPAMDFLDAVTGVVEGGRSSSADRPVKLAVVDPAYFPFSSYPAPPPPARVTFEGETTLSAKAYALAGAFIPRAGQRVYLVPQGNGYLIAGSIDTQTPQGFWQEPDGVDAGVELGGGSYFDTTEGLVLETDLTVNGDISGTVARGLVLGSPFTGAQVTTATTEKVMDHFTGWVPEAGRRYELRWMTVGQGSVAGDAFAVRFKYLAGSGALTAAGTEFMRLDINGTALAIPQHFAWAVPTTLTAGQPYAIGVTVARLAGTGTWTANTAGTGRRLEIHDVGRS